MADQKVSDLAENAAPLSVDLLYLVDDPDGAPADHKLPVGTLMGGSQALGGNLIRNSPSQIVTDGAEPQWWDDVANAAITDEDAAGEACEDKTERVFKVVTTANNVYGLQTLTFADEDLLDAGQTVVSLGWWVWCASASKASIAIYGTNLGLQESGQHSGGSGWEWFTVENITLDGADTDIEIRAIVDTGTAFYTMPMLCVGPVARPWVGRQIQFVPRQKVTQVDLSGGTGDVAWTSTDCTTNTDNLTVGVSLRVSASEPDGTIGSNVLAAHGIALLSADTGYVTGHITVLGQPVYGNMDYVACEDDQTIRYQVGEVDADSDVSVTIVLCGYWHWV